jgi:multisubunit Na+/H+ antiporter MnhC subunit
MADSILEFLISISIILSGVLVYLLLSGTSWENPAPSVGTLDLNSPSRVFQYRELPGSF